MRPGRAADHSSPSSAVVMEEWSYTSTHPLGHTRPVTGTLYLFLLCRLTKDVNAVSMFIATKCNSFQLKFSLLPSIRKTIAFFLVNVVLRRRRMCSVGGMLGQWKTEVL